MAEEVCCVALKTRSVAQKSCLAKERVLSGMPESRVLQYISSIQRDKYNIKKGPVYYIA